MSMKISPIRIRSGKFAALLTLILGAGAMQATVLNVTSPVTVTCNPVTGPGAAASIVVAPVTPLTTGQTLAVTVNAPNHGLTVTAPTSQTLSTTVLTLTYTVNVTSATCANASIGPVTIQFNAAGNTDATSTANVNITSPLVTSSSSVALTCQLSGTTYNALGSSQTVSVTSAVTGGTAFTVDSGNPPPTWVSLGSFTGGTATATGVTFTVTPATGCGSFLLGSVHTGTINLASNGVADKVITVTLTILGPNPLTGTLSSSSLTYVKNSGSPAAATLSVTSNPSGLFFLVNTATLPVWLTVNTTSGTAPNSLVLSTTSICDTLAPGTYTATIQYYVTGDEPASSIISLLITNKAATLSVLGSTTQNLSWVLGTSIPTASITLVSTDAPIAYTAVSGGALDPIIPADEQAGLAYNFGTTISMTFNPLLFDSSSPGTVLTGTVTITSATSGATIVVTVNITVVLPGATLTGLTPASLPTAAAGSVFNITLAGANFVASADPTQKTRVGVLGAANAVNLDPNLSAVVINPSNIALTITVPATADPALPFALTGAGGTVVIAVCNPAGAATCTVTGQQTLTISPGPIVQAITSASSFTEVAPGTNPTTSAYDILSVFGSDFCASGGTGCGSTTVLTGTLDAADRYKTSLSPDNGVHNLTVSFYAHGTGGAFIASAPLLFATNSQINLLVPAAVNTHVGAGTVDLVVNFGTAAMPGTETAAATSAIHTMNIAATDPGVFTEGADGQGTAAALAANYTPIVQANPAGMRATTASDTILLYVSGLGVPNSAAADSSGGHTPPQFPGDCISIANYETAVDAATGLTLSSIDGAILQSSLIDPSRLAPCMATASGGTPPITIPAVSIGGVTVPSANIKYAGFVEGSVAGLYQINVKLPSSTGSYNSTGGPITNVTSEVALPVLVSSQGASSQAGVYIWVQPELLVTAPTALTGTVGVAWSGTNNTVTATDGTQPYTFGVTAGTMPNGVTLTTGGAITGTPSAGTGGQYEITVTATDSSTIPITGSVQFTLSVAAGLYLTGNPAGNQMGSASTAIPDITQVTAAGGVAPYTYQISVTPPPMTSGSASDIILDPTVLNQVDVQSTAVAGTYTVTVTATDSTPGTPLTGSYTFTIDLM
jgi:uncharacterized protein (TIGR03437 family)